MAKKASTSKRWLKEHFDDSYVQRAQREGYRSRACYKLLELHEKDALFKPGMTVVDLGAAPGGWSQVATQMVTAQGWVVASDILPMDNLAGVNFVQGDFTEQQVFDSIVEILQGRQVDLVISDMAPNMSGISAVDQPQSMYLVELALDMATQILKPGGVFLTKVFQGEGFDQLLGDMRRCFKSVISRKPAASRSRSREVYQVCKGFKG